jgi:hypothetical protein
MMETIGVVDHVLHDVGDQRQAALAGRYRVEMIDLMDQELEDQPEVTVIIVQALHHWMGHRGAPSLA